MVGLGCSLWGYGILTHGRVTSDPHGYTGIWFPPDSFHESQTGLGHFLEPGSVRATAGCVARVAGQLATFTHTMFAAFRDR